MFQQMSAATGNVLPALDVSPTSNTASGIQAVQNFTFKIRSDY
jgi:hypothetical protein